MAELAFVAIMALIAAVFRMRSQIHALRQRVERLENDGGLVDRPAAQARVQPAPQAPSVAVPAPAPPPVAPEMAPVEPERHAVPPPEPIASRREEPPRPAPALAKAPTLRLPTISFEDLFGRRLPIWAGGATLAVAGVLIVKYSIDAGLLSPLVRVICGLLFGTLLIAGAEAALRFEALIRDPRVAQALSGAGIASLYASILIAANLYGLIGSMTAFLGLAGVTALAMGLSIRFGAPSALLGLVGGLAAPALVGSTEPNVPLLATYLALAVGGLCTLSRTQRWLWLGIGALIGGFGWGAILLATGALDAASTISLGLYLLLIGIGLPLLIASGRLQTLVRAAAPLLAALQMAALVATGGFGLLHWGLFALISIAIVWMSGRDAKLIRLPVIGVVIALALLGLWREPPLAPFAIAAIALGLIYAVPAIVRLWRPAGSLVEAGQVAAIALGGTAISFGQFYLIDGSRDTALALVALTTALLPAGAAALGWRCQTRNADPRFATLATAAALLAGAAAAIALPAWSLAPVTGLIAAVLLLLANAAGDRRVEISSWAFSLAAAMLLVGGDQAEGEFARVVGTDGAVALTEAVLRWTALAAVAALFAWRSTAGPVRAIAQGATAVFAYGAIAQIMPLTYLPIVPALGLVGVAAVMNRLASARLLPALTGLFGLSALWAAWPLALWGGSAYVSLVGEPMLTSTLPTLLATVLRLAVPAAAIGGALWLLKDRLPPAAQRIALGGLLLLGGAATHILFKQVLRIDSDAAFIRHGLIERTLWEALLAAIGIAVWRWRRWVGLGIAAAGFAHFAWYTLILHNPLWWDQAVGGVPVISWLIPAYALPLALLWLAGRFEPALAERFQTPRAIAQMVLISAFSASALRQIFAGDLLTVPGVGDLEDILRSVVTIGLAIGFLLWGIAAKSRLWRVASLLLMIAAVIKVFLFDASGLDGLARIGSFVALGLSLIGIGWLYSRQLAKDAPAATPEAAG